MIKHIGSKRALLDPILAADRELGRQFVLCLTMSGPKRCGQIRLSWERFKERDTLWS